jgi:hypothetical protein
MIRESCARLMVGFVMMLLIMWGFWSVRHVPDIEAAELAGEKERAELIKGAQQEKKLMIYGQMSAEESRVRLQNSKKNTLSSKPRYSAAARKRSCPSS